jgi:hypothetical protein
MRHLSRRGDYFESMDHGDGYYALGIREESRDFFTFNNRGELRRLACMPMGLSGSTYYSCKLTHAFTNCLRRPTTPPTIWRSAPRKPTRRFLRNIRWRGARMQSYMDVFM